MPVTPRLALCSAAVALFLAGCGGGGGSTPVADAPNTSSSSGVAVDGYVSGATVVCDTNGNGIKDGAEVSVTTNARGGFTFAPACTSSIAITGGTNVDTGFAFVGVLRAPAGATVASPLTTLMVAGGLTAAELATALGLPAGTDVTRVDPADGSNPELFKKTLAVQQVLMQAAQSFGAAGAGDINTIYSQVGSLLASAVKESPNARIIGSDGSINTAILSTALSEVAQARGVSPSIAATLADTFAQQAEAFLKSSDADIVAISKQFQAPSAKIDLPETPSYMALANDSILINSTANTLAALSSANGITVSNLETLGVEFSPVGGPELDITVGVGVEFNEVGGSGRKLKLMIDKVDVSYAPGTGIWAIQAASNAKVYVNGRGADGTEVDVVLSDLSFNPLTVTNNRLTLNYVNMIDKVLASESATSIKTTAQQFRAIKGTYDMSMVVTRMNLRKVNGDAFTPVTISIPGNRGVSLSGHGASGRVTLN